MSRKRAELRLGSRIVVGAIAGFVGTMAMTRTMRKLHARLPEERDPPTPREIVDAVAAPPDEAAKDAAAAAHFLYGAASGALLGAMRAPVSPVTGAVAGAAIWICSDLGWIRGAGILKPATRHPARRNLTMIAAHLAWGWTTAKVMRELCDHRDTIFAAGADRDVPGRTGVERRELNPPSS